MTYHCPNWKEVFRSFVGMVGEVHMKKVSMGLVVVLSFAFAACELDKTDEGVTDDTITGDNTTTETVEAVYKWVRISDDPDNESLSTCGNNNPGADIDAVAIVRGGSIIGWVDQIVADKLGSTCGTNTAANPNEVKGNELDPDASDAENMFLSLNGGEISVHFADMTTGTEIVIQKGDQIKVFEIPGTGSGQTEYYDVDLCEDAGCATSLALGNGSGEAQFTY